MTNKIYKKELKSPDFLQTQLENVLKFIIHHQSVFYGLLAFMFLGIAVVLGWYLYQNNYNRNALTIYNQADRTRLENKRDFNITLNAYKRVINKYPRSQSALYAHYMIGNLYLNTNQTDLSLQAYEEFLKRSDEKDNLYTLVLLGKSYCYEVTKQYSNALNSLENALRSDKNAFFASLIYRDMGRIYEEVKDRKKSIECYQKSFEKTTDPTMGMIIKRKISELT